MTSNDTQLAQMECRAESIEEDDAPIDREKAQQGVRILLEAMGEDPERSGLIETWKRRVPDVLETFSEGERIAERPTMRTFDATSNELVVKTGIPIYSLCEHHLLPFHGTAHVAYRPNGEVVGLSKLARYVRWQSRRLTMQEELTNAIAEGLTEEIDAEVTLVEITAQHLCESMRGVETETATTTRATVGDPTSDERRHFTEMVRRAEDSS